MRGRGLGAVGGEAGYTLVELLVAMTLLSIAIIPMFTMFDVALRTADRGSTYDQARVAANGRMEAVRALPFANDTPAADSLLEVYTPVNEPDPPAGSVAEPHDCGSTRFPDCTITTTFVNEDYQTPAATRTFWVRVEVNVRWDDGEFTTTGLVSRET